MVGFLGGGLHRALPGPGLDGEQDVPHPKLIRQQLLVVGRVQQILHVLLADADAPVHHVALQALNEHFSANVLPEGAVAHAVVHEGLLELLDGHLVLLGERGHGPGQRFVIDLHAPASRLLQLNVLQHQPFHQLADQHVVRGRLDVFPGDLLAHHLQAAEQLRGQHHVVIDDGDDAVQLLVLRLRRARTDEGQQ